MSIRNDRDFLRIWSGQVVSNLGDGVHRVAVLWWANQATGSSTAVVAVALAASIPLLAMAPVAGVVVDRHDRRHVMIASDLVRLAAAAAFAALAGTGHLTVPMAVAITAVAAAASGFFSPALMASVTSLVPDERLPTANSMIGGADAVAGIGGPALGGLLIGLAGTGGALWFDAGTFLLSVVAVAASRIPLPAGGRRHEVGEESLRSQALAGWRLARSNRAVGDLVLVASMLNMVVAPVAIILVGLAAGPLGLDGKGYGLLEAAVPIGLLAGFASAVKLGKGRHAATFALLATGAAVAASGAVVVAWWTGALLVVAGVGIGVANTLVPTRFQRMVEPSVQGRVFALVSALSQAGRPVGLALTAPLVALAGLRGGLAVCGAAMVLVALAGRRGLDGQRTPARPAPGSALGDAAPLPA